MTRLGLISDIHVDLNRVGGEDRVIPALAAEARRRCLDLLLVAGDISSDYERSLATLTRLEAESGSRVLFVPGNHDIWNESHPGLKAQDTYGAMLDHPGNLARAPIFLPGGWAIVGDLGWYDFAYGDPSFSLADFERMQFGERTWQDKIKSIWDRKTHEVHTMFLDRLRKAADAAEGHKLVFVTHVVPIPEFTVQNPGPQWKYFNAFLGSPAYGELALELGARLAVCGHVHYRRRVRKAGTDFVCPCLGYQVEWPQPADPERQVAEALVVYELGEGAEATSDRP